MLKVIYLMALLGVVMDAASQTQSITDGPYLFYRNDSLFIEEISNGQLKSNAYTPDNAPASIQVSLPGRPESYFTVPFKKKMESPPSEYKMVDKLFVTSDIEGNFNAFEKLLLAGGVIDQQLKWTFGTGHLVVCGDLFDRSNEVTACLWLLYKLEEEAKANGGFVHVIMGNHEIMNLSEDFRYVHPKYMEAAKLMNRNYAELYSADTELGRWLRTKNIMEKIGSYLFLHAGVSQQVNETNFSLKKINARVRPLYDKDGMAHILEEAKATVFFGNASPFWYRGYFASPAAPQEQVDQTLRLFNVKKIIVGHTIVDSIRCMYNGKIIAIDVDHHKNHHEALVYEKDCFYRINTEGIKTKLE